MDEIVKGIKNLDSSKATQQSDIPKKCVKENAEIFADFLYSSFNECI